MLVFLYFVKISLIPMIKSRPLLILFVCISATLFGQEVKLYPTNWFAGMKNQSLQIMVHGIKIANEPIKLTKYAGVSLLKVNKVENPNYLFLDLKINAKAKAGFFLINIGKTVLKYELKARFAKPQTIDQSDFIYLLMPDRFSNGDKTNDKFRSMADTNANRKNPWQRHGGDLQGVMNHLDYLKELGVSALWMTPVIENDQPLTDEGGSMRSAYHGYGFTDHYNVDKRLGGNDAYKKLVDLAHKNGIKVIQDAVYNHVGINHFFVKDLPSKDWLNQWDKYTNTSYKDQPIIDIHASEYDRKVSTDGWFVPFLPDLNHKNPFLANFLIQHALWSVENFGVDAWRIDTYIYNDMEFMNRCNKALLDEHPNMLIYGESWVQSVFNQSYFTKNNINFPFKCNQPSTCDFQLEFAIMAALKEDYGWNDGVNKLYQTLAQDFAYQNPEKLVTFLDNHDFDRFYSMIGEDPRKFKLGLTWLMTTRGIPQIYYGTEIKMKNFKNPSDAEVRKDFPGGFEGDSLNKFTAAGRNANENESFEFVKKLANLRKNSDAIGQGKLVQFLPSNGIYTYFRVSDKETVMVVSNTNKSVSKIPTAQYQEVLKNFKSATNIFTNVVSNDLTTFEVEGMSANIYILK